MCSNGMDSCQGFNPVVQQFGVHGCDGGCNNMAGIPPFNNIGAGGNMMLPANHRNGGSVINVSQQHGPPLVANEVDHIPMSGTLQPASTDMGDNPYGLGGSPPGIDTHHQNYCVPPPPLKQSYHGTLGVGDQYQNEPCYHMGAEHTQTDTPLFPDLSVVPMPSAGPFQPQVSCAGGGETSCTESKGMFTEGKGMSTEGKGISESNMGATIDSIASSNEPTEGKGEGVVGLEAKGGSWSEGKGCPCEGKEGCPCEEKGMYSEGKGMGSEGKGMGSEGKGLGSEGKGMGSEGKGEQQEFAGQSLDEPDAAAPPPDSRPPPSEPLNERDKKRGLMRTHMYNYAKKSVLNKSKRYRVRKRETSQGNDFCYEGSIQTKYLNL